MDTALDLLQAQQTAFVTIASFTVLCWDHIITFSDEVDLIWHQHMTITGYLFLLNRYIIPLGFIVNAVVLALPTWSSERCRQFVWYEGAMSTIGIGIAQLIMLQRVWALYSDRRSAIAIPALIFVTWLALQAYVMPQGKMLPNSQQVHSCRGVYDFPLALSVTRAWLPLTYDTAIFVMTVWRTLPGVLRGEVGRIHSTLLLDGVLYYGVIFTVNLVLTVTIIQAPPGLKSIPFQLAFLLTVVMTSRVTINLRKQREKGFAIPSVIQRPCSIHPPSPLEPAFVLEPHRVHRLFANSPHLRSQPSQSSCFFPSIPIPSALVDASPIDDVQSFWDKSPVSDVYDDVESIHYERVLSQIP